MRRHRVLFALLVVWVLGSKLSAAELPGDYFKLMATEVKRIGAVPELPSQPWRHACGDHTVRATTPGEPVIR